MIRGHASWLAFEWMHVDCFPDLIQFACLLPPKEDNLRKRTTKVSLSTSMVALFYIFVCLTERSVISVLIYISLLQLLLAVSECFGDSYLTHIMLPVFLVAVGDAGDLTYIPSSIQPRIKGSKFPSFDIPPYHYVVSNSWLNLRFEAKDCCG